jgi:uncharacterized protein
MPATDPEHHGLHTRHDLTWIGRLRLSLRRQSRALYRSIRHPKNRCRGRLRAWLADKIRNRGLWRAERAAVAAGLSGGLFFSMLPIPLQSFVAAGVGIARGWNLPSAIAATWLSNPLTYLPMLLAAKGTITGFCSLFGMDCAAGRLDMETLKATWSAGTDLRLGEAWNLAGPAMIEIGFGMVLLGTLLAVIAWVVVQLLWGLFTPRKPQEVK